MFKRTSTQESLLEPQWLLPREKRERLRASWAQVFRQEILPRINEEPFRPFFEENNGQPNKSIRLLVGVHLLKERFDLTDEQVIENLEFHAMWHHALGVEPKDAHVCQKTLHNFRTLVVEKKLGASLFVDTTKQIAKAAGISFARQRQDSTHVVSNMAILSRLGIFVETIAVFLRELRREEKERFEALPASYAQRYLDREGYFADAKKEQARRRLPVAAQDLFRLVQRFASDEAVAPSPSFALMQRVLAEQCTVVERPVGVVSEEPCEPGAIPARPDGAAAPEAQPTADDLRTKGAVAPATEESAAAAPARAEQAAPELDCAHDESPAVAKEAALEAEGEQSAANQGSVAVAGATAVLAAAGASASEASGADVMPRDPKEISSASLQSPYDPDATYGHKGKGYEVQLTETCAEENPFQLITSVGINGAHESDQNALLPALDLLAENGMAPDTMIADTAYGSGENIVEAAQRGTALMAPVQDPNKGDKIDVRWDRPAEPVSHEQPATTSLSEAALQTTPPAEASGPAAEGNAAKLGLADFQFSPDFRTINSCPAGNAPYEQTTNRDRVEGYFDPHLCHGCPLAGQCPCRRAKDGGRRLGYRPAEAATAHRQREQRTPVFKAAYKIRSAIESTNSQLKGAEGADDLRVRGKKRVGLVMTFKALAVNVFRYVRHVVDEHNEAQSSDGDAALAVA